MFISKIPPSTVFRSAFSVCYSFFLILFASFVRNYFCTVRTVMEIKETVLFGKSDVIVLMAGGLFQYNFACCFILA